MLTLSPEDLNLAISLGTSREMSSRAMHLKDDSRMTPEMSLKNHILGSIGEFIVAQELGFSKPDSINTFKEPDLPGGIQVRASKSRGDDLILRPADAGSEVYIQVLVDEEKGSGESLGWIYGHEGKKPWFWNAPNGRPGAWFVDNLHSMKKFPLEVKVV